MKYFTDIENAVLMRHIGPGTRSGRTTFVFPRPGHDPYNHTGRFAVPVTLDFRQINMRATIVFDEAAPSHDPRNHTGSRL